MENREFTSSESKDYMGIPGKGMTTYMYLRTKIPNNKQKSRFAITDITNQDFKTLLKKFKNSYYLGYKIKQVHNEPTEAYLFPIKQITKLLECGRRIRYNFVQIFVNKTIWRTNEDTGQANEAIQSSKLESSN